ncbi:MAG TPA: TerB family tellurite resistance protein [Acidobacteriota bacterium]|nr:TerB family tellurite resistance protein [Acidobacteriota bacterium]
MSLLRFLGLTGPSQQNEERAGVESLRRISKELDQLDPEKARYLAAFAYLLGRVAHADMKVTPEETDAMEKIVMKKGDLPHEQAALVVEIAKRQNQLFGHVENFLVTREFRRIASRQQKLLLLDCLFAVSASDKLISTLEDREIRQIASELKLEHSDFIAVRSRYRDHLAVLKRK